MKTVQHLVVGAIIFGFVDISFASPCVSVLHPDGRIIRITGVLQAETEWGPPNFGENPKTDSKWTAWILHVDVPFRALNEAGETPGNEVTVEDIQLELSNTFSNSQIAALVNKHISVEGLLWYAQTPGDVKDFNVRVASAVTSDSRESVDCVSKP